MDIRALFERLEEKLRTLGCTEEEVGVFSEGFAKRWESYVAQYGEAEGRSYARFEFESLQVELLQLERAGVISRRQREQLEDFIWGEISE